MTGSASKKSSSRFNWTRQKSWNNFNWNKNQGDLSVDLTEPEVLIYLRLDNNQKNLSVDLTEPDESLGISSTGIRIREILASI